jgi:hypothetical protein
VESRRDWIHDALPLPGYDRSGRRRSRPVALVGIGALAGATRCSVTIASTCSVVKEIGRS